MTIGKIRNIELLALLFLAVVVVVVSFKFTNTIDKLYFGYIVFSIIRYIFISKKNN